MKREIEPLILSEKDKEVLKSIEEQKILFNIYRTNLLGIRKEDIGRVSTTRISPKYK